MKEKNYKQQESKALKVKEPAVAFAPKSAQNQAPEGYLTVDEFKKETSLIIDNLYKKHGLLCK